MKSKILLTRKFVYADSATELLKERYGNLQALISAYMKHFVMLPNTESVHNVKGFGNLFDKVESSI